MLMTLLSLRTLLTGCLLLVTLTAFRSNASPKSRMLRYAPIPGKSMLASVGDRIVGRWYFPMRESDIEIYRENGRYFAKIVAVSEATTAEFGAMNNKMLLTDLTFNKNEWAGGKIIHPQTGSRFDVFLKLSNANTLVVTAYKGCRLFSRAYMLTRI